MTTIVVSGSRGDTASVVQRVYGARPFHTDGDLLTLGFAPDGTLWSVEEPGVLRNWDLYAQKQIEWHPLDEAATQWCFNRTTRLVAAASNEISVWVAPNAEELAKWTAPSWVTAMAFSPDSQLLATGHDDGIVRVWDWHSQQVLHELKGHSQAVSAVAFSPEGPRLASAGEDRLIKVWDYEKGQQLGQLEGHTDRIPALAWHPDNRRLVSAGWDTTARVWDTTTFEPLILLNSHAGQVHTLAFSPEGHRLACADAQAAIHLWDFEHYTTLTVLRDQAREASCLAFSPDGQRLAAGGAERVIHVWDARRDLEPDYTHDPLLTRTGLAVTPDGLRVLSVGVGTPLRIWDTDTTDSVLQLQDTAGLQTFALSPDGQWVAASLSAPENPDRPPLALYETGTGRRHVALEGQEAPVTSLAFAPDSSKLASASFQSGDVWIWDVPSGQPFLLIPSAVDDCSVDAVLFHPGGRLLAVLGIDYLSTSGMDGQVTLWDSTGASKVMTFRGGATRAAFHPSGDRLAVASLIQSVRIFDLATQTLVEEWRGFPEAVTCLAYSPDGRWLATGSDDRTVRLWDAATGEVGPLVELDTQVKELRFSPDGRYLYTGNANTSCYQLDVQQLLTETAP